MDLESVTHGTVTDRALLDVIGPRQSLGSGSCWPLLHESTEAGARFYEAIAARLRRAYGIRLQKSQKDARFRFPGSQPVALRRSDLEDLRLPVTSHFTKEQRDRRARESCLYAHVAPEASLAHIRVKHRLPPARHYCTWKSNGDRYLLLFDRLWHKYDVQVLVSRTGHMSFVWLDVPGSFYNGVILDGELMPGQKVFEVFGVLQAQGTSCRHLTFADRYTILGHLVDEIRQPAQHHHDKHQQSPLREKPGEEAMELDSHDNDDDSCAAAWSSSSDSTTAHNQPTFRVQLKSFLPLPHLRSFVLHHGLCSIGSTFHLAPLLTSTPTKERAESMGDENKRASTATSSSALSLSSSRSENATKPFSYSTKEPDGLIIYPNDAPLLPYLDRRVKKIKAFQTLDFFWRTTASTSTTATASLSTSTNSASSYNVNLYVLDETNPRKPQLFAVQNLSVTLQPFAQLAIGDVLQDNQALENQIVECGYCHADQVWKPIRVRIDKDNPNSSLVAADTLAVIAENVTLEEICAGVEAPERRT
jgi:hypothetical protein